MIIMKEYVAVILNSSQDKQAKVSKRTQIQGPDLTVSFPSRLANVWLTWFSKILNLNSNRLPHELSEIISCGLCSPNRKFAVFQNFAQSIWHWLKHENRWCRHYSMHNTRVFLDALRWEAVNSIVLKSAKKHISSRKALN